MSSHLGTNQRGKKQGVPLREAVAISAHPTPVATSHRLYRNLSQHEGQTQSTLRGSGFVLQSWLKG